MNATTRRLEIAEHLRLEGEASIADLAQRYGTSEMTIRRDLDALESDGLARLARGGAIYLHNRAYEPPVHQRASAQASAKRAIGAAAAAMVRDDETVILDIGSTTAAMARCLRPDLTATVVTHSLLIAGELASHPGVRTLVTGGVLRPGELAVAGADTVDAYRRYNCDALYLGVAGVDLAKGLTEMNDSDAHVKRAAIDAARRVVVLADATKLGRVTFTTVAGVDVADALVTDAPPSHPVVRGLGERGVEVIHVEVAEGDERRSA